MLRFFFMIPAKREPPAAPSSARPWKTIFFFLICAPLAHAAKIGELTDTSWTDQAIDFWKFQQPAVRTAVIGTALIGLCCGLLGSFLVVRKLALMGDTLSHAVLPGVAAGFLWSGSKDPLAVFVGATIAGVLGVALVNWIKSTTHLKEDSAMGMVLAGFYGIGICMTTMIQKMATGNKSGLDKFFFGQAAALNNGDIQLMAIISLLTVLLILLFYKEFLAISFDIGFAGAIGMPVRILHYILMAFLAFAVVVSLQAVGVVLVSALLIPPAATAFLLTDRMHWMLILAAAFGIASGIFGAFISYLSNNLPTGPFIVLGATALFTVALFFGPRHGVLPKALRRRRQRKRIGMENTLKAVFHLCEDTAFEEKEFELKQLAMTRNIGLAETEEETKQLEKAGFATVLGPPESEKPGLSGGSRIQLTDIGWERACEIVRNHRLWELYLSEAASYQSDHVHDDAEEIEHLLGEEIVSRLEDRLSNPIQDPHGRLIPSRDQVRA